MPETSTPFEDVLGRLAKSLDASETKYMVIGGLAVVRYAEPRMTDDIDLTIITEIEQISHLLDLFAQHDIVARVAQAEKIAKQTMVLLLKDAKTELKIDVILGLSDYEKQAVERAMTVKIQGASICFATPEDLIIHKLIAGRARDLQDARSILTHITEINHGYIVQWLESFDPVVDSPVLKHWHDLTES